MNAKCGYAWKDSDVHNLISNRVKHDAWFNGKRGTAKNSWERLAALLNCGATGLQCHKKWLYLIATYKDIILPATGSSLEEDDHPAHVWPFFDAINRYMSGRHTINPVLLVDSVTNPAAGSSSSPSPKTLARHLEYDDDSSYADQTVVIRPKKKRSSATSVSEATSIAIMHKIESQIAESNAQIERSLNEQALARQNEAEMLEMIKKYFYKK